MFIVKYVSWNGIVHNGIQKNKLGEIVSNIENRFLILGNCGEISKRKSFICLDLIKCFLLRGYMRFNSLFHLT